LSGRRATAEGRRKLGKRERLAAVRPWELQLAANVLGISGVAVASYPGSRPERQADQPIGFYELVC
jgi:LmbE family N-acetylglucosaminyl deacetylase